MPQYITTIPSLIDSFFKNSWESEYGFDQDSISNPIEQANKNQLFRTNIEDLRQKIFDNINASVLIGEYVEIQNIEIFISDVHNKLNTIQVFPSLEELQRLLNEELNVNFIECIKSSLKLYSNFILEVKLKFEIDDKHFLIESEEVESLIERSDFSQVSKDTLLFLASNISIAKLDHFLTAEPPSFYKLLEYSQELLQGKALQGNKYSILLRQKCNFLVSKWVARKIHSSSHPLYASINNTSLPCKPEDFTNDFYNQVKDYVESHYELVTNWATLIESDFSRIKNAPLSTLSLKDLHRSIKYYKDVKKDIANLDLIIDEIKKRYDEKKNAGEIQEIYTYSMALTYAMNNKFSLLLETNKSETQIEHFYEKILSIQASTGINNFFPQYKFLNYWVNQLQQTYNQRKALESISVRSKEIIKKCEEIEKAYSTNVEWAELKYNYVFQLPYNECLFTTNNQELRNIYIASSFLLPLPKDRYKLELEENKRKVLILSSSIEVYENIEKDINELNKDKEEVLKRDIRSMEILGIFTAIVTFVAGSLPTFQFVKNVYQAALFMLSLSSSLAAFVLIILIIGRGVEKLKKHKNLALTMVGVAVSAWCALLFFFKDPIIKDDQIRMNILSDSIQTINQDLKRHDTLIMKKYTLDKPESNRLKK